MINTLLLLALVLLTILFLLQMRRSLKRSTLVNSLINEYIDRLDDPALIDAIYAYCTTDWRLRRIMKRYGGTRADIEMLFQKLLVWANFRTALRPHLFLLFRRLPRLPAAQQGRRTEEARDADDEFLPYLGEPANLGRARPIISCFHN